MCNKLKDSIYSYNERMQLNTEEKAEIAKKASMFINENKTYFFDVSTTIKFLCKNIKKKITVFTHSLDNLNVLSEKNNVLVYSIGEIFNNKNRYFYGDRFDSYFHDIKFDIAFLGAAAIKNNGVYYDDKEEVLIKRQAAKRSKLVVLLAEHQKYQAAAYYKGFDLNEINVIIVDKISLEYFLDIINSNNNKLDPRNLIIM